MLQEQINKVKTYIGFSIKSKKIIWGYDNVLSKPKHIKLIIICSSLNDKMKLKVMSRNENNTVAVLNDEYSLSDLVNKSNAKVVAITDTNLANAILQNKQLFNTIKRGNI